MTRLWLVVVLTRAVCRQLTDQAVMELAGLKRLVRLVLVRVHRITDTAINYLADHTPSLQRLHLSYCDRITLKSLHHLMNHSRCLEHLRVTGVPAARRRGLGRFSDPPPEVRLLSAQRLSCTDTLTDVAC